MTERGRYRELLALPAYLRVFSAGLGSVAGSAIASVSIVWIVYASTGSALPVGLLGASWVLASILFSLFGGVWVDRYDRRRLMIASDLARAAAVGGIVLDLELQGFYLPAILALYFVLGAFSPIFDPAEQALVPSIVPPGLVADANGLVRSSRSALQFAGTALAGGMIVTVGPLAGLFVNVGTFLLSAFLLFGMKAPLRDARGTPGPNSYLAEIAAGFRWLYRAKGFFQLTLSATLFNFCSSLVAVFLVVFSEIVLHGSALVFAGLLAARIAGTGLGSLLVGPTRAVRWAGRAWVLPYGALSGGVVLALVLAPSVPGALLALFALGVLGGFSGTAWLSAAQLLVPSEMQGRYFGVDNLGSILILPFAQLGGALLIAAWGVGPTYLAAAVVWVAGGLAFLVPRALWDLGYRAERSG